MKFIKEYLAERKIYQILSSTDKKYLKKTIHLLRQLYKKINAKEISLKERERLNLQEDSFTYGEIDFLSFLMMLHKIQPKSGEVFYDLGSGTGRAVFTAALCFDLSKACGIEWLPALHDIANQQLTKIKLLKDENYQRQSSHIQFINDNFLNCDIADGDIIFLNATCLSYSTWEKMLSKLKMVKPGARILVTSKKIPDTEFKLLEQNVEWMSWGLGSVNYYEKRG